MVQNILSRSSSSLSKVELSLDQIRMDGLLGSFSRQASDPYSMAAVLAGGTAFRALRGIGLGSLGALAGESRLAGMCARAGIHSLALVGEAGAFVGTERALRVGLEGADSSLLHWRGSNGMAKAWLSSIINFGSLRWAGSFAANQNAIFRHAFSSTAMVGANQFSASLGITPKSRESLMQQFVDASVLDLQMTASMGMLHTLGPGLALYERSIDLEHAARMEGLSFLPPLSSLESLKPALAAEAIGKMPLESSRQFSELFSNILMMAAKPPAAEGEVALAPRRLTRQEARQAKQKALVEKLAHDPRVAEHAGSILEELQNPGRSPAENIRAAKVKFEEVLAKVASPAFLELRHLIPNGLTAVAALMAVWGSAMSIQGDYSTAAKLLIAAALIDKADGVVARAMRATHSIGAKLDSYADFANYGIASALLSFSVMNHHGERGMAWVVSTLIALNATLRLATFDYLDEAPKQVPPRDVLGNPIHGNGQDFTGMPSTMMGLILPAVYFMFGRNNPDAFYALSILAGSVMYSPLRYPKLTDGVLGALFRSKAALAGALGSLSVAAYTDPRYFGWAALLGLGTYVASPFIQAGSRWWRRNRPTGNLGG